MTTSPRRAAAAAAVVLLAVGGLAACSSGSTARPSASPTASSSPSPTPTLPADQQQAVDEAAAVVLKYQQMVYSILADPSRLNDLYNVLAEPQVSLDLPNLQQTVSTGKIQVSSTGPVKLASVEPVIIDLTGTPPTITLVACVDKTATAVTYDGKPWTADRELAQYRVVKTTYLPSPGWAVAEVLPPPGYEQTQTC